MGLLVYIGQVVVQLARQQQGRIKGLTLLFQVLFPPLAPYANSGKFWVKRAKQLDSWHGKGNSAVCPNLGCSGGGFHCICDDYDFCVDSFQKDSQDYALGGNPFQYGHPYQAQ